jgi:site-specific recombinase XerD
VADLTKTTRFMDPGYLAPLVAEFSADLRLLGYARLTIQFYAASARHFAAWVCETGLRLDELDLAVVERFARHHCRCPGGRRWSRVSRTYAKQTERFVLFLAARGVFALTAPSIGIEPVQPGIRDYKQWLADHRGLSAVSIARQGRMLGPLLTTLGADPQAYNAAAIRAAVRAASQGCTPSYVKTMTTALRGYLRFLAASGLCRPGLDGAIGQVAQWRLSALPRYLSTADVGRVIATCDGEEPVNLRNRAALLLLARLGLRAGDVWSLRLDDFDWTAATLRVRGKSRCEVCLPLPQEVGDAVLAYIERGRPAVVDDRLFLLVRAPYRPFTAPSSISDIVDRALRRAGIDDPPSRGAGLLRHSAATTMLRDGSTLETVAAVLRHRSINMTAHYAKVDVAMLSAIAQPWPGEG